MFWGISNDDGDLRYSGVLIQGDISHIRRVLIIFCGAVVFGT